MAVEHTTPGLHTDPECTGAWRHLDVVETRYWRCKGCGALAYDCASVRRTILIEHSMATRLRFLELGGQRLLDRPLARKRW